MPDAWRIDRAKRAGESFTGKGAAITGGRWNPPGMHVVYASEHLATASLEKYVHLTNPIPKGMTFVKFSIEFNGIAIERPPRADLPLNWTAEPVLVETQVFGTKWYERAETAVLAVPSAIIPEETNYILNPSHLDFRKILISRASPLSFDPRLATLVSAAG